MLKEIFGDEMVVFLQRRWPFITKLVVSLILLWWSYISFYTPTNVLNAEYKWADKILPDAIWAAPAWFAWLAYSSLRRPKNEESQQAKVLGYTKGAFFVLIATAVGIPLLGILFLLVMCLFGMCISV